MMDMKKSRSFSTNGELTSSLYQLSNLNLDKNDEMRRLRSENDRLNAMVKKLRLELKQRDLKEKINPLFSHRATTDLDVLRNEIARLNAEKQRFLNASNLYEKLVHCQRLLIGQLEKKYNDVLHSLIDSFENIDGHENSYERNNIDQIQADLNNLMSLVDQKIERRSDYSTQHQHEHDLSDDSLNESFEDHFRDHIDHRMVNAECQCNLTSQNVQTQKQDYQNHNQNSDKSSSAAIPDEESQSLQELISNYLELIKSYKLVIARLDKANQHNSQLKLAYSNLNDEYTKFKQQSHV